ncbi:SKP1-like protein 1A [Zingiber officinale]|uniref:SKP1-like protein 1A n=1 Tax=Zingiber officinale TaxID=94328 RepID=UPI001C4AD9D9|nr:SKP1-like protein 1A [Zingiber officinale]
MAMETSTQESPINPNIFTFDPHLSTFEDMARMITLRSSDCEVFEVEEIVIMEILAKVVEYYKKHIDVAVSKSLFDDTARSGISNEDLKSWDAKFVKVD